MLFMNVYSASWCNSCGIYEHTCTCYTYTITLRAKVILSISPSGDTAQAQPELVWVKLYISIFRCIFRALIIFSLITAWNICTTFCFMWWWLTHCKNTARRCATVRQRWHCVRTFTGTVLAKAYSGDCDFEWLCCWGAVPMVRAPSPLCHIWQ